MISSKRRLWVAFVTGLMASGALGGNCNPESVFACSTDEDCLGQGEGGLCEAGNVCSFPDEECPSGRRWHHRAPIPEADMCIGSDVETGTEGEDDSSGDGDPTAPGSTSSTTEGSATTPDDDDDDGDSTSDSGEPQESSSGEPPSCDEQYGGAPDYMLCEETAESCSFNATIDNAISCNDVCEMFGGTCIEAHLNEEDLCVSTGPADCGQSDFYDGICVCTRP